MDASEAGRFGTLRLMKRLEPDKVVASYPIDDEEITLGRDPICNIRLYYETVSGVHCKIIFRERKAFLVVLGVNGAIVDGCPVFPTVGASVQPVTVPLPNNSSVEVHKKRFQFCYPPKELRSTLISTPSRSEDSTPDRRRRRRALRMSMIQSAQVFTPRPSQDPRENLRILRTPIKSPFARAGQNRRLSSPLKRGAYIPEEDEEEEEEERDIVLVESTHPEVVEEDSDLVILERVIVPQPEPEPPQQAVYPIPQAAQPPAHMQQTPARRRPRSSLHRAVLLKSAHRSMLQREMEMEEEREVEEVEEIFEEVEQMQELQEEDENGEAVADEEEETGEQQRTPVAGWRKSLSLVKGWAFGGSPAPQAPHEDSEDHQEHELSEAEYDETEEPDDTPTPEPDENFVEEDADAMDVEEEEESPMPPPTARGLFAVPSRPLGKFMTPQVSRQADFGLTRKKTLGHVRYSVGGFTPGGIYGTATPGPAGMGTASGPRRVRVVEPWRVDEITVPLNDADEHDQEYVEQSEPPVVPSTPQRETPISPSKRERLTEGERKAIIQRRKSALTEPDLFGGQTPGRRLSMFPLLSPAKPATKSMRVLEESPRVTQPSTARDTVSWPDAEEAADTSVLLARMKHMVEDAKRRQSMGPRPSVNTSLATPRKSGSFSLLAPDADNAPVRKVFTDVDGEQEEDEDEDVSDKENDVMAGGAGLEQAMDEDVRMDDGPGERHVEPSGSRSAAQVQTPRLGDLRHVFGAPRTDAPTPSFQGVRQMFNQPAPADAETPRLDGIRPMFTRADRAAVTSDGVRDLHRQGMATPTFEGVGEMLATPDAYQADEQLKEPPGHSMVQESEAEEDGDGLHPSAPARSIRQRKPPSQKEAPAARRTSPRVAPTPEPAAQPDAPPEAPPARGTRKTRSKATESDAEHTDTDTQPKAPRRTRRTTPSPAPEEPTRTLRKTRAKTPTPTLEDVPRTGTGRRRARTPIAEVAEEEDPIDALGGRAVSPEVPVVEGDARVRRSARAKLTLQVKEEPEEERPAAKGPAPPRTGVPRAVRGRRPAGAAATVPRTSSIPRGPTRGAKTASLKRPATTGSTRLAAEAVVAPVVGNKENTPEPDDDVPAAGTSGKLPAARPASRLATKVGTRTVGRTRGASVDQPEKPAEAGRSRVSRTKVVKK